MFQYDNPQSNDHDSQGDLIMDILGAIRLKSLPNALKGGCGYSQDTMIIVHLVPSYIIRIM